MDIDIGSYPGDSRKPVVILIHGLGMDKTMWENPSQSRILGGSLPISILLKKPPTQKDYGYSEIRPSSLLPEFTTGSLPHSLRTVFHDLRTKDYPVLTWSQKRPLGPLAEAVAELSNVVPFAKKLTRNGVILVGHSRGGLIARKYLMNRDSDIKGIITISAPHRGSSIAKLSKYIRPLVSVLAPFFSNNSNTAEMKTAAKRVFDFLSSRGVRELMPESLLDRKLQDQKQEGVFCMTIGGTSPSLFSLYRWKWKTVVDGSGRRWILSPEKILAVPDILEKIIPETLMPDEIRQGLGDGLVTAESSMITWCNNHQNFPCNHAGILFDRKARQSVLSAVGSIS